MRILSELQPAKVFSFFEDICAIPHGSGDTKAISDYVAGFARAHKLKYRQDSANNVVIWKEATPGYENAPTVMVQGHMDMVCEKNPGCDKDMTAEGLDLFIEGDLLGAKGTTLGGDDGIAVAMALAILDSDDIPHGPLECLFTVDEEVGMGGARALDASDLKAEYLLNIDSEQDRVFTVSCAGSARVVCSFPEKRAAFDGEILSVQVSGLQGGHSGAQIHLELGNAAKIMGRVLYEMSRVTELRLLSVAGGNKDNAIPREVNALIAVRDAEKVKNVAAELDKALKNELFVQDPEVFVAVAAAKSELLPMTKECTDSVIGYMFTVPDGVQNMSAAVKGLVQTSVNLGQVYMRDGRVHFSHMPRSSVDSQKDEVISKMEALCRALGGEMEVTSTYSAWQYRPVSKLRDTMVEAFRAVYGEEPRIEALHAGLECGILSGKLPGLDCISYGPDLTDIHTPRERLSIASTMRVWNLTLEALKRIK